MTTSPTLLIENPATGQPLTSVPADEPAGIARKFAAARAAQPAWAAQPLAHRLACLTRFRAAVAAAREELAHTTTSETGKPIAHSRNEINGLDGRLDFFLSETPRLLAAQTVHEAPDLRERVTWEPLGVIGNISAWNYPYFVGGNVFIPALLTGNAVLYKPSEFATLTGLAITRLLHEAGVPDDVFSPIVGGGATGAALLAQPLAGVFFTGSYATGKKIAQLAASSLMKVQLELGGKDPVYVTDDVNVTAAAEGTADGAFYNAGQSCCAVERLYVHAAIYDEFVATFLRTVRGFVTGDPLDADTYVGPLTRTAQLDVLAAHVRDAVDKGAHLLCGGARLDRPGNYFAPTVLTNVTHDMLVMREETFGPVIGIQKVADDTEAARLMADTEYGLTAGVYSRDESRATAILAGLPTGSVYWNCCDRVSPRLPWSGRGHSGLGSTLGAPGITAFVQPKAWHLRRPA